MIKEPIREEGPEYLFKQLKNKEFRFDDLNLKFSATLIQDKKDRASFSGQLRIRRDSIIWVTISPALGIEAIRAMITPDSVFVMNRIDKTYLSTDFGYVNRLINAALDFDMLQAFLTGNDFAIYEIPQFRASIDGGLYRLNTSNRNKLKKYIRSHEDVLTIPLQTIWLDPESFKITRVQVKELEVEGRKVTASYSVFSEVSGQPFPSKISIEATAEKSIDLELEYTRIERNTEVEFPFRIPSTYTPIAPSGR
ncbi:MAG: DUF4292 domain-containing protein, partial [Bacteroidales bacterium]|nr:DUF4292 domain-containing protein [Bacteroidales bacterium]